MSVLQTKESKALNEAADQFFEENTIEGFEEDAVQEKEPEQGQEEEVEEEETDSEQENNEGQAEDENKEESDAEDKENNEDVEDSFEKDLSGFNQDFKNVVNAIDDPELKINLIEAAKKQRASIDRKHQEYGESKKLADQITQAFKQYNLPYTTQQYADIVGKYVNFHAQFVKDPKQAISQLAQDAKLDIKELTGQQVENNNDEDEDYYKTPEEIATDKKLQSLEQQLAELKQTSQREQQELAQQELQDFASAKDDNGDLLYPHFDKVRHNMALLFNDPNMTLEKAYKKAVLMDDELATEYEQEVLRKAEQERKAKLEKAKKLKRQMPKNGSQKAKVTDPKALLREAVEASGLF